MQGKNTTKSTFNQFFSPIFMYFKQLTDLEVDKYVKNLETVQLIQLIAYAQLEQQRGLRDISNNLNNDEFQSGN